MELYVVVGAVCLVLGVVLTIAFGKHKSAVESRVVEEAHKLEAGALQTIADLEGKGKLVEGSARKYFDAMMAKIESTV